MKPELEEYCKTGEPGSFMKTLGATDKKSTMLALQGFIQSTGNPVERNALEDIAFIFCHDGRRLQPSRKLIETVKTKVASAYGEFVDRFIDIPAMVAGIAAGFTYTPSVVAMVAAIGVEAERCVGGIKVRKESFGREIQLFTTNCKTCGGDSGGAGHMLCGTCLENVRKIIRRMPSEVLQGMNIDTAAGQLLVEKSKDFGCSDCGHRPVRACDCQTMVRIPKSPRDGEILKGRYTKSSKDWFCCIRLAGE